MLPSPILPHSVNLILQYIAPPSQLNPIPPHLLSRSLLQRHHFLNITPDDPATYLCWASSKRDKTIELLELLPNHLDDHSSSEFQVQYASDVEHTYAHVHVSPSSDVEALRLVFQWDPSDSNWKYHDANLMPFPPTSHVSLDEALAPQGSPDARSHHNPNLEEGMHSESDDDDYWNSYGGHDDQGEPEPHERRAAYSKSGSEAGEEAYWAQYASVQGSADSTMPSPVVKSKRKLHPAPEFAHDSGPPSHQVPTDEPLPIPYTIIHPRAPYTHDAPPSPGTLARRLTALSPRGSQPPSMPTSRPDSAFDDMIANGDAELIAADEEDGDEEDSETPSPPQEFSSHANGKDSEGKLEDNILSPRPVKTGGISFLQKLATKVDEAETEGDLDGEDVEGVKEAIKGVYRLWAASQRRKRSVSGQSNGSVGGSQFLRIVREVIEE
ncbi:hypothetical protein EW146_g4589 [Bondarzewia mesenterica]|uniref:Uncharacterized protein n=1 Tax=Bondarzewia mesenterica TaxID=1095465 RepID=A0A4V3XF30_9AGAM|nr:hypothetical protein EW146_g4589 [Bondarzewia mesenterica]